MTAERAALEIEATQACEVPGGRIESRGHILTPAAVVQIPARVVLRPHRPPDPLLQLLGHRFSRRSLQDPAQRLGVAVLVGPAGSRRIFAVLFHEGLFTMVRVVEASVVGTQIVQRLPVGPGVRDARLHAQQMSQRHAGVGGSASEIGDVIRRKIVQAANRAPLERHAEERRGHGLGDRERRGCRRRAIAV